MFVKSSAPKCCCPQLYSAATLEGHFFCPRNVEQSFSVDGYEGGPFANSVLGSLAEQLENDIDIDSYPYVGWCGWGGAGKPPTTAGIWYRP